MSCDRLRFFVVLITGHVKGKQARSWPQTKGLITTSKLDMGHPTSDMGALPNITYDSPIEGKEYTGRDISFTKSFTNANKVIKRYPVGSIVQVYYNPENHEESVLEVESEFKQRHIFLAAFVIPTCIGIYLLFL